MLWYCQFDVSPVNYSDSDLHCGSESARTGKAVLLVGVPGGFSRGTLQFL